MNNENLVGDCGDGVIDNIPSERINIEDFKSIYYLLNAKPDTQLKVIREPKRVLFEDIVTLNEKIENKIKLHDALIKISSINVIFKDGSIKEYTVWKEFLRIDRNCSLVTESISIIWDLSLLLPGYELPQRHTLKVRIGSDVKPIEYFHLMAINDNDADLEEGTAFLIAKVDFISSVLANELIQNVVEWYNCLSSIDDKNKFQNFLTKQNQYISRFAHYMIPLICFSILYLIFKINFSKQNIVFDHFAVLSLYYWFLMAFIVHYIGQYMGGLVGRYIYEKISKIEDDSIFLLTAGDNNVIRKNSIVNKDISNSIVFQILLTVIGAVVSAALAKYI